MTALTLAEELLPIATLDPAADAAGRNGRGVSLKNAIRAFVVFFINQGNAATVACSIEQCTAVAGTGNKAISASPIWSNLLGSTVTDAVRRTDAASYTTDAALLPKIVIFQIEPAKLDQAGGFDCIRAVTGASNAANITSAMVIVQPSYPGANPGNFLAD